MDQLQYCGHYARAEQDIEMIASLGVEVLRYPVIWDRLQPSPDKAVDWSTVDTPLNALRRLHIKPIAGLVHHGSGPAYADLLSPSFATGLSAFAQKVAERYPWLEYFTPVNEPLTTARFSGLYGLWFPHKKCDREFARMLVNQMTAIVLAMQKIRKINPQAKLVQTEDLAKIYSTPRLQYQADFENHRRWLTWDFLCGKVNNEHPLWEYFISNGIPEASLYFFVDNPCSPDIVGVDYYATSERYLDEALDQYPPHTHGANSLEPYADVEAIRVRHDHHSGIKVLLQECWERYELPIAVTEAHINCDFDNQIRWFGEMRQACTALMMQGIDIRALTAWALFGAYGWNTLLTLPDGDYESGAFDVRTGVPVRTPLADYLIRISHNPDYIHPAESEQGWWHREDRFVFERDTEEVIGRDCG